MNKKYLWLQLFTDYPWTAAGTAEVHPVNVTTQANMADTMKTFFSDYMLQNIRESVIFSQFGKKTPIHGNTVEWRKWNTFDKALTPLTEGVIPDGKNFGLTAITASTTQHGDYTVISDRLENESYDDVILGATEEMSSAQTATYDTLTRNILVAGTNVQYAHKTSGGVESTAVQAREDLDATCVLTSKEVNRAVTTLTKYKVPKINGSYIAIIHPSQAFDLRESKGWLEAHEYASPKEIYNGEIGSLHGVRFIVAPETKVYCGADLTEGARNLTVKTNVSASTSVAVKEAITADDATALAGRGLLDASGNEYTIASASAGAAGSASITLSAAATISADAVLYPAGGGAGGAAVYCALFFGKDAFAIVDPEGEDKKMYIKGKEQVGGPIEQFSTIGYKFNHGAKILYQERLIRLETGSDFSGVDEEN